MNKLPSLQFYPSDWKSDPGIQSLSFEDRQVWIEILFQMHESPRRGVLLLPNGKSISNMALSRIIGFPESKLIKALERIADAGVSSVDVESGALMNRRMVRDEAARQARAEGGPKGGDFGQLGGEFGKLGGRPKKPASVTNLNPAKNAPHNPPSIPPLKPSPSSSSSSSSSSSKEKGKEKYTYGSFANVHLTVPEFEKLCVEFTPEGARQRIENLSAYVASKGKKYSSHYATILVWNRKNEGPVKAGAIPPLQRPPDQCPGHICKLCEKTHEFPCPEPLACSDMPEMPCPAWVADYRKRKAEREAAV